MASQMLQPLESFDFHHPDSWSQWKKRFEQYRLASGLNDGRNKKQINTLLYCMGPDAEEILQSTNISDSDRENYQAVVKHFDDFFSVRRNTIFERARFNRRDQQPGESAEQYILAL